MSTYTITNPTDIFSLIMNVYGTLDESVKLLSDNSSLITSLESDVTLLAGEILYYNPSLVVTYLPPKPVLSTPPPPVTEFTWQGLAGQNMFDVCIQTYGALDLQVKLMNDNSVDFSTQVYLQPFNYDSTLISDSNIWDRTTGMNVIFSTGNIEYVSSFDGSFEFSSFENTIEQVNNSLKPTPEE